MLFNIAFKPDRLLLGASILRGRMLKGYLAYEGEIKMDKKSINQAIINRVGSSKSVDYSAWTIGLTHDTEERKQQHEDDGKSIKYWIQWIADSLSDAEDIESHFINEKGMKGGTGGNLSAHKTVYVYIF